MKMVISLATVLLLLFGCHPAVKERTSPAQTGIPKPPADTDRGSDSGTRKSERNAPDSPDALRRLQSRMAKTKVELRRRNAELELTKDFLTNLSDALQAEDYPQALASIDRFLRAHPGHSLNPHVFDLRSTVEKLQAVAVKLEAERNEKRRLKKLYIDSDADRRKEGS